MPLKRARGHPSREGVITEALGVNTVKTRSLGTAALNVVSNHTKVYGILHTRLQGAVTHRRQKADMTQVSVN